MLSPVSAYQKQENTYRRPTAKQKNTYHRWIATLKFHSRLKPLRRFQCRIRIRKELIAGQWQLWSSQASDNSKMSFEIEILVSSPVSAYQEQNTNRRPTATPKCHSKLKSLHRVQYRIRIRKILAGQWQLGMSFKTKIIESISVIRTIILIVV